MANAGDFNGDGYEDLIISASPYAQVHFGGPLAGTTADIVLEGATVPVASAGDMNGDGYGDIVAPSLSPWDDPRSRVYFGGKEPDGVPDLFLRDIPRDWVSWGSAAAVDFNGDGFSDVLVAAPGYLAPYDYGSSGRAYLFLGGSFPDGDADATFESQLPFHASGDYFARLVASAGDLNGDGYGDFLVTEDRTYVSPYLGSTLVYLGQSEVDTIPDASLPTLVFGSSHTVTAAGDLNADGAQDVAVQGVIPTTNGYRSGCAYIYLSAASSNPTRMQLVFGNGAAAQSIVGGRDVNGDGHADLVVACVGSVYVFFGGAQLDSIPDITLKGEVDGDGFGFAASTLDWTGDGVADVAVTAPFPTISGAGSGTVFIYDLAEPLRARSLTDGDRRAVPIADSAPTPLRVRFEPVDGSYASSDVDPQTIRLRSEGTGVVSEIPAIAGKANIEGDSDRNGVPDLLVSFSGADLAELFSNVTGRRLVDVTLEGRLRSRRRFAAPFSLTIVGTGSRGSLSAAVQPNPLNPGGTLSFRTSSPGTVSARLFDLHGRCVRVLLRGGTLAAGDHRVPIDGRGETGHDLASGVYFYRIDSPDGPARGRLVVAK